MAVSGVSFPPVNNYQNSPQANFRQTFMQMVKAIKSGDLSGAQQAYATLAQMQESGQGPGADQSSVRVRSKPPFSVMRAVMPSEPIAVTSRVSSHSVLTRKPSSP